MYFSKETDFEIWSNTQLIYYKYGKEDADNQEWHPRIALSSRIIMKYAHPLISGQNYKRKGIINTGIEYKVYIICAL